LSTDSKVSITNTLGQTIVSENLHSGKHELNIYNQANGIYFVKVIQNTKQHTIKLIKE
ncbi:MAG: T9SS type A sorting domain-containing protein, partial [Bacteroidia bacterium]|nr:T9SS type A sorting domain-containing protein [Bacteroidia bacterium]